MASAELYLDCRFKFLSTGAWEETKDTAVVATVWVGVVAAVIAAVDISVVVICSGRVVRKIFCLCLNLSLSLLFSRNIRNDELLFYFDQRDGPVLLGCSLINDIRLIWNGDL